MIKTGFSSPIVLCVTLTVIHAATINCNTAGYTTLGRGYFFRTYYGLGLYSSWTTIRARCTNDLPGASDLPVLKDPVNYKLMVHNIMPQNGPSFWVGFYKYNSTYVGDFGWQWVDGTPESGNSIWPKFLTWNNGDPDVAGDLYAAYSSSYFDLITASTGTSYEACGIPSNLIPLFLPTEYCLSSLQLQ
jgi:hypothetical protein